MCCNACFVCVSLTHADVIRFDFARTAPLRPATTTHTLFTVSPYRHSHAHSLGVDRRPRLRQSLERLNAPVTSLADCAVSLTRLPRCRVTGGAS